MKVYQFINKLLYASSNVMEVYVCEGSKETRLSTAEIVDPTSKEDRGNLALLSMNIQSFRIVDCKDRPGCRMNIYVYGGRG